MSNKTTKRNGDINAQALGRWNGEGGAAATLKLWTATLPVQDSRLQELAADVSYDLWRFSCEMPDAPHLSDTPTVYRLHEHESRKLVGRKTAKEHRLC
jgi:hypothetical protein